MQRGVQTIPLYGLEIVSHQVVKSMLLRCDAEHLGPRWSYYCASGPGKKRLAFTTAFYV